MSDLTRPTRHVISVSGGKDSAATLLIALERCPRESVVAIFCDTENEDQAVYQYLDYLEQALDITIHRLRANFSERIAAKRNFIARDRRIGRRYTRVLKTDRDGNPVWLRDKAGNVVEVPIFSKDENGDPTDQQIGTRPIQKTGWDAGKKIRWSNKAKRRALAELHPTGNAFLDLCLWKGRFPSRKAQFCTHELKRDLLVAFQIDLADAGYRVVSWQGIRRDESLNRSHAKKAERIGPHIWAFRPLVNWTAMQVFDYCASKHLQPNPLYKQGMSRVGCMPCINCSKGELRQIAARFPAHILRISEWEQKVGNCSKQGFSTLLAGSNASKDRRKIFSEFNILSRVEWSKTSRGGKQIDLLLSDTPSDVCASAYGLCD